MKKIFLTISALLCSMSISAQIIKIYKGLDVVATYTVEQADSVVFSDKPRRSNFLSGKFTINASGKQVQFTRSNLYWDGSAFKFEENQTDYQTNWNANHVSHFYWTQTTSASYVESYDDGTNTASDVPFFAPCKGGLTVDGSTGLYALSSSEWGYLLNSRTSVLHKNGVTVTNGGTSYTNCLIIAPDDFTGTLQESYTLEEVNAVGLVCLPAAGWRDGSSFGNDDSFGYYWTATPNSNYSIFAFSLGFSLSSVDSACNSYRHYGFNLRLVRSL